MKQYIMTTPENQKTPENLIQKDQKPDVDRLEKSLISLSKNIGTENDDKKKLEDIVREIVAANIPAQTIQDIMNNLPLDKRFIIEKMMRDEQRRQIMTMSPEKYTQYLQAQFPTGVPTNV